MWSQEKQKAKDVETKNSKTSSIISLTNKKSYNQMNNKTVSMI